MSDTTRTVDHIRGKIDRKIEGLKTQMKAFCDPLKEQVKELERQKARLLLEDGEQLIDMTLFAPESAGDPGDF